MPVDLTHRSCTAIMPLPIPDRAAATVVIDGVAYAAFDSAGAAQDAVKGWQATGKGTYHNTERELGWPAIRGRKVEIFAR